MPEVNEFNGFCHIYLSVVPGIFTEWRHARDIIHFTSTNLLQWKHTSTLKLAADRVIDACATSYRTESGACGTTMSATANPSFYAGSKDLFTWEDHTKTIADQPGEEPDVLNGRANTG